MIDAHLHVVPPGLPGVGCLDPICEQPPEAVAARLRDELRSAGVTHALAMGRWDACTDADPLGVQTTLAVAERVPGLRPPLDIVPIQGGRSNLTLLLRDAGGDRYVLRRPPLGAQPGTAHDVLREGRIVAALAGTGVPVAPVVGSDGTDDVVGAPFFVMRYVDAAVLSTPDDAHAAGIPGDRLATALAGTLAELHTVDLDAVGLGGLRRPGGYPARQLRRLSRGLDHDARARFPMLEPVRDRLAAAVPPQAADRLVHGDYKLGNVMVDPGGAVRAVLDWELTSVGDPLADVGWLVASWAEPGDGPWLVPPATLAGGFPGRAELAAAYAEAAGRDLADLDYYVALAYWRWSCINAGTRRRYLAGTTPGELDLAALDAQVGWQLDRAYELLGGSR